MVRVLPEVGVTRCMCVLPEVGFTLHLIEEVVAVVGQKELVAASSDDVLGHGQPIYVRWACERGRSSIGIDS